MVRVIAAQPIIDIPAIKFVKFRRDYVEDLASNDKCLSFLYLAGQLL
jgi:uncharacterized membrane protein YkgB